MLLPPQFWLMLGALWICGSYLVCLCLIVDVVAAFAIVVAVVEECCYGVRAVAVGVTTDYNLVALFILLTWWPL